MFQFFYSLFMAMFAGTWTDYTYSDASAACQDAWADLTNWLMNALGGEFATLQTYTWTANLQSIWATALSLVTLSGLCWMVWTLTKHVFSIFFGGRR